MAWTAPVCVLCLSYVTLLYPTQRDTIFGNIFAPCNNLEGLGSLCSIAWIKKWVNNNKKGRYFENIKNIKNIKNIMIFSLENIMILSWYISLIYIIDLFVPTLSIDLITLWPLNVCLGSFKVTENEIDFLLIRHCNYSSILYHFPVIWRWIIS